ncbi:MAG TPA: cysteine peptidase family C39 domain-containing protein, partial [Candidatus Omnitrophota bacterium]|nr:cysteine peptidase family C39 domain-containing protein [Candidatus Omnitrophota bacterium]
MEKQKMNHISNTIKTKSLSSLYLNGLFVGFSKPSASAEVESGLTYRSNIRPWIRAVALAVVLIFTPEQICAAFNYNPAVLWGRQKVDAFVGVKAAATVSESIKDLLTQIRDKEQSRVKIELPNTGVSGATNNQGLILTTSAKFTQDDINSFDSWLKQPSIHHLNCGVYALRDLLQKNHVGIGLEEASVLTLTVDILGKIIKAGEPRLKTSLYSLNSIATAYGLNVKSYKIAKESLDEVEVPFIASLEPEHFVLVTEVADETITVSDIGEQKVYFKEDFLNKFTGYVLASSASDLQGAEIVSHEKQAFIWGSQWANPYEDIIKSQAFDASSFWTSLLIDVVCMVATFGVGKLLNLGTTLAGLYKSYMLSRSVAAFVNTVGQIGVMKWGWDAQTTGIICSAVATAITIAVQGAAGALDKSAVGAVQEEVIKNGGTVVINGVETAADAITTIEQAASAAQALNPTMTSAVALNTIASSAISASANTIATNFLINFGTGLAVGAVKGFVGYQITKLLEDSGIESDVLKQAIAGIAISAISNLSTVAITAGVDGLANLAGDEGNINVAEDFGIKSGKEISFGDKIVDTLKIEGKNAIVVAGGAGLGFAAEQLTKDSMKDKDGNAIQSMFVQGMQQLGSSITQVVMEDFLSPNRARLYDSEGKRITKDRYKYSLDDPNKLDTDTNNDGKEDFNSNWRAEYRAAKKQEGNQWLSIQFEVSKKELSKEDFKYKKDEEGNFIIENGEKVKNDNWRDVYKKTKNLGKDLAKNGYGFYVNPDDKTVSFFEVKGIDTKNPGVVHIHEQVLASEDSTSKDVTALANIKSFNSTDATGANVQKEVYTNIDKIEMLAEKDNFNNIIQFGSPWKKLSGTIGRGLLEAGVGYAFDRAKINRINDGKISAQDADLNFYALAHLTTAALSGVAAGIQYSIENKSKKSSSGDLDQAQTVSAEQAKKKRFSDVAINEFANRNLVFIKDYFGLGGLGSQTGETAEEAKNRASQGKIAYYDQGSRAQMNFVDHIMDLSGFTPQFLVQYDTARKKAIAKNEEKIALAAQSGNPMTAEEIALSRQQTIDGVNWMVANNTYERNLYRFQTNKLREASTQNLFSALEYAKGGLNLSAIGLGDRKVVTDLVKGGTVMMALYTPWDRVIRRTKDETIAYETGTRIDGLASGMLRNVLAAPLLFSKREKAAKYFSDLNDGDSFIRTINKKTVAEGTPGSYVDSQTGKTILDNSSFNLVLKNVDLSEAGIIQGGEAIRLVYKDGKAYLNGTQGVNEAAARETMDRLGADRVAQRPVFSFLSDELAHAQGEVRVDITLANRAKAGSYLGALGFKRNANAGAGFNVYASAKGDWGYKVNAFTKENQLVETNPLALVGMPMILGSESLFMSDGMFASRMEEQEQLLATTDTFGFDADSKIARRSLVVDRGSKEDGSGKKDVLYGHSKVGLQQISERNAEVPMGPPTEDGQYAMVRAGDVEFTASLDNPVQVMMKKADEQPTYYGRADGVKTQVHKPMTEATLVKNLSSLLGKEEADIQTLIKDGKMEVVEDDQGNITGIKSYTNLKGFEAVSNTNSLDFFAKNTAAFIYSPYLDAPQPAPKDNGQPSESLVGPLPLKEISFVDASDPNTRVITDIAPIEAGSDYNFAAGHLGFRVEGIKFAEEDPKGEQYSFGSLSFEPN